MALTALVLGDNCIDRYLPPVARDFVGGQAVNVAAGLAAAGITTGYAGCVGTDDAGRMIVAELSGRGVDVSAVEVRRGQTGVTVIANEDGDRRFVSESYGVSAPYVPSPQARALLRDVRLAYAAHVDDLRPIADHLPPGGALAFDASEGELAAGALGLIDILFVSCPGWPAEAAATKAEALLGCGPAVVVVTLGAEGAIAARRGEPPVACPASGGAPVDTLGAGDALASGFLAGWISGASLGRALEIGSAAAAAACSHLGALPAVVHA